MKAQRGRWQRIVGIVPGFWILDGGEGDGPPARPCRDLLAYTVAAERPFELVCLAEATPAAVSAAPKPRTHAAPDMSPGGGEVATLAPGRRARSAGARPARAVDDRPMSRSSAPQRSLTEPRWLRTSS